MKAKKLILAAVLAVFGNELHAQESATACAKETLEGSIEAFGGTEVLNSLHRLKIKALGQRLMREQSERPEGPYIPDYFEIEIEKDLDKNQLKYSKESKSFGYNLTFLVNDSLVGRDMNHSGRWFPVPGSVELDIALAPERLLQTALEAKDLQCEQDSLLQNIPHRVVSFKHNSKPVKIYINRNTGLVTAIETKAEVKSNNYHIWGDLPVTVYYSMYGLEKNNLIYPRQIDIYIDGKASENISLLSLEQNPVFEEELSFPEASKELLQKYFGRDLSAPLAGDKAIEEAKGLYIIPGSWFTSIIKQDDGLVILDAPISSAFSEQLIQFAHEKFPGQKIKAVINSSGAWPHIGGLRTFIAEEVPVYHSPLNTGLLEKLAAAEFSNHPDRQQELQKKLISKPVSAKTELGKGQNKMQIFPLNAEASEGMMMVYFPKHKLLYTTDLVQSIDPSAEPLFREYTLEILKAIDREQLEVEKIFGMHLPPTELSALKEALQQQNITVQ
ncbi:MAG: hypothetical protein WBL27_08775 [Salinimicrobium sp.]